jgi:hypothetical protein
VRDAQALLERHLARHVQLIQRVVHRLHAVLLSGLHHRVDLVHLVVADEGPDGWRRDEDLGSHRAAAPLGPRQQRLGDDALERERELRPNLRLLV